MQLYSLVNNNNIMSSGVDVDDVTPYKLGESVLGAAAITGESIVDLTPLAHNDYPMWIHIHPQIEALAHQGDSGVTLAGVSGTALHDGSHHTIRVDSDAEAYIALKAESSPSGVVYFTRIDKIYA